MFCITRLYLTVILFACCYVTRWASSGAYFVNELALPLVDFKMIINGAYPKRILISEEIQNEFENEMDSKATAYNVLRLQSLSATRWTTKIKAADVVFLKTAEVHATLEMLLMDPSVTNQSKARIRSILERQLSSLNVVFNLNATRNLAVLLEKLSKEFPTVDITTEYVLFSIRHVIRRLEEMGSEEEFEHILSEAKKVPGAIENRCEDRQRKLPRWMNDGEMMLMEGSQAPDTSSCNPNTEQSVRSIRARRPFSPQNHRANLTECNEDERCLLR